jgi:hypothetical protein
MAVIALQVDVWCLEEVDGTSIDKDSMANDSMREVVGVGAVGLDGV